MDRGRTEGRIPSVAGALALGVALALGACADDPAPQIVFTETGTLEGFLFFDENRDGAFDPADGDFEIAQATVQVRNSGSSEVLVTGMTGADGRVVIPQLPIGTHDLLIDTATVDDIVFYCRNPVPFTIYVSEVRFQDFIGLNGCVISIAEAEALDPTAGEFVTVKGIVISAPGEIDVLFAAIQDASGGIKLADATLNGQGLERGDRVELSGTFTQFSTENQIAGVTVNSLEKGIGQVPPAPTTTAAIVAAGADPADPLQGTLVEVSGAELVAAFGSGNLNIQNGRIDDGSGPSTIRVDDGVWDRNDLDGLMQEGKCYDIVGIPGNFNGDGQIFPRRADDIVEVPCS